MSVIDPKLETSLQSLVNELSILYRGPLSSCNYDCHYCPFSKQTDSPAELAKDREDLERFVVWCKSSGVPSLSVFFTPWGEALTRKWYWSAFAELSHMAHIRRIAVQTNISCGLDWIKNCDRSKLGFWCTFHPEETSLDKFVKQCQELMKLGVRFSVGIVGLRENLDAITQLRERLPSSVYVWVNAYKSKGAYYSEEEVEQILDVDPLFNLNNQYHNSLGKRCSTGEKVISVDGDGNIYRCHFVREQIGNLYELDWHSCLKTRNCPNATCGCHIGFVHLNELKLHDVFKDGILERIPVSW